MAQTQKRTEPTIKVDLAGIQMKNPVMTASGTFGYGSEYADFINLNKLGAVVVKGITTTPKPGAPIPRILETPSGMLNAIGLQNVGIDEFIDKKLPYLRNFDVPVIVNICGEQVEEYLEITEKLNTTDGIAAIELNISCPNLYCGGISFGVDPKLTDKLVKDVRKQTTLPIIVKLSPNVTDITVIARAAENAGANGLSMINTILGMAIDINTRYPQLANITGGLSGPAIKPIALRMVWQVYNTVNIPIIGIGGIMNSDDAIEFHIAGASAVAVGTANFINPRTTLEVIDGIKEYLKKHNINSIQELVGSLKPNQTQRERKNSELP